MEKYKPVTNDPDVLRGKHPGEILAILIVAYQGTAKGNPPTFAVMSWPNFDRIMRSYYIPKGLKNGSKEINNGIFLVPHKACGCERIMVSHNDPELTTEELNEILFWKPRPW
jgi:hypothetical protein